MVCAFFALVFIFWVIKIITSRHLSLPEEDFVHIFSRIAYMMLENAANLKTTSVKQAIFLLLAVLVQRYKQGTS